MSEFILNGEQVTARDDHPHLLAALRDELGITSAKDGCSPTGQCGCCTVLIGGKARVSCQTSMDKIDGGEVTTLEGFDPAEVQRMADAFAACGALQCGFCTPGIVVRTKALIDKNGADLTREQASRHLGAHLCRCTGYIKVLDAVEALAQDDIPVVVQPRGVGSRGIKYEGRELSIGTRDFIDDMNPQGCLHGALRLTDHARADITSIDASAALAVDGVRGVFTAEDIPGVKRVGIIHKDWPIMIPVGGRTSYLGDVLVVVVADTRQIARAAAELVAVKYEVHEPMVDPVRVITSTEPAVWELDGNILSTSTYTRGDADVALASSSFTVSETFQTQRIEHAFLEPESTLAVPTRVGSGAGEPGLYVYSGGQGIFFHKFFLNSTSTPAVGDRTRLQWWRVRWQGRHVEPGAHGARGMASRSAGQDHAVARRVAADAPEAPSDSDAVRRRLRCRWQTHSHQGSHDWRLRSVRIGRHEGARTGGRSRHWSVCRWQR